MVPPLLRFASVGYCIYCGSTDGLTDEHIVPAGLDGYFLLPDASCTKCAKATSRVESRVMNSIRTLRGGLGLGEKRRKTETKWGKVIVVRGGNEEDLHVPIGEHPLTLPFPLFPKPGVERGMPEDSRGIDVIGVRWVRFGQDPADLGKQRNAEHIRESVRFYSNDFSVMLAKIAYSYAIATLGAGALGTRIRTNSFVVPAIRGTVDDIGLWVGTVEEAENRASEPTLLHKIGLHAENGGAADGAPIRVLYAHVQLFANSPSVVYRVLIGWIRDDEAPADLSAIAQNPD